MQSGAAREHRVLPPARPCFADEVKQLLGAELKPWLPRRSATDTPRFAAAALPSRADLEKTVASGGAAARGSALLARLDRGETLPASVH